MFIRQWKEKREKKKAEVFSTKIDKERHEIERLSYDELQKMHADYYNGIACDKSFGYTPSKLVKEIDCVIVQEMEKRGMKTLYDLEEDAWFNQHRKYCAK